MKRYPRDSLQGNFRIGFTKKEGREMGLTGEYSLDKLKNQILIFFAPAFKFVFNGLLKGPRNCTLCIVVCGERNVSLFPDHENGVSRTNFALHTVENVHPLLSFLLVKLEHNASGQGEDIIDGEPRKKVRYIYISIAGENLAGRDK